MSPCLLVPWSLLIHAAISSGAEVVPVKGQPFAADLVSIDGERIATFRTAGVDGAAGEERKLPLSDLVRWGHPVAPRPQTIVVLADGGRLVAASNWSGGAPVRLEGDSLIVLSGLVDRVSLKREAVRGIVFAHQDHPREREELVERVSAGLAEGDEPSLRGRGIPDGPSLRGRGNSDVVLLTNGDRLEGTLSELAGGSIAVASKSETIKLPVSRVVAVALGKRRRSSDDRNASKFIVGLRDGSLLYLNSLVADDKRLSIDMASGVMASGTGVENLKLLQSRGGRFVYLSDLEPSSYRHVPYLSIEWPYKRDRNVLGEPLMAGGEQYLKGIGMHSASRLTYPLNGQYKRFEAAVALDDSTDRGGSVTFGVYVQRDGKWLEAFKSEIVRGGEKPLPVSVDVAGATGLTLTVDFADRGDELDRANWLDARLMKAEVERAETE